MRSPLLALLLAACTPVAPAKDEPDEQDTAPGTDTDTAGDTGAADGDGDGAIDADDCAPEDPAVHPGAPEACNTVDDDCDGAVDEGVTVTWFEDADGDGYVGSPVEGCEAPAGSATASAECDDTRGAVHPGAEEVCGDGLDNDCLDGDWRCRIEGDFDAAIVSTVFRGAEERAFAGQNLSRAGDVDGDGRDDLWITAYEADGSEDVFLVSGALEGEHVLQDVATTRWWRAEDDDDAGFELAGGDDLDGDGVPDLAMGAPGLNKVYVGSGTLTGELSVSSATARVGMGALLHERVGNVVSTSPDLTGDGVGDLIVGSLGTTDGCAAWLFPGPVVGEVSLDDAIAIHAADARISYVGRGLGGLGDVNGDGAADLLVGDIGMDVEGPGGSGASVFFGPITEDAIVYDGDRVVIGEYENDWIGQGVTDARGDVDGDGMDDFVLIAPYSDHGGELTGAVYVLSGSATAAGTESAGDATARVYGDAERADLSVAHDLADVDGDGFDDLVVTAMDPDTRVDHVVLLYGPLAGVYDAADPAARLLGGAEGLDQAVAVGDTNGDGLDDLLFGKYADSTNATYAGAAYLFR